MNTPQLFPNKFMLLGMVKNGKRKLENCSQFEFDDIEIFTPTFINLDRSVMQSV